MVSKVKPKVDEQYNLLDVEPATDQTKVENGNAGSNDPAFAINKMLPVHRWVLFWMLLWLSQSCINRNSAPTSSR